VEVRLELLELSISKSAELERVGAHRNRVSSIKATSQSSSEDHASGRHTSNLEATRTSRSKAKGSAIERLAAHVVVVLRDRVEGVDIAALVDAAAVDEATEDAADERGSGAEDTVAGEAFAVETLLGFDGGGEDHGEGDEGVD
jgi:hypothetical protein